MSNGGDSGQRRERLHAWSLQRLAKYHKSDMLHSNSPDCCSKVYISARGPALKSQYHLLGDYYEMTDCEKLKDMAGCDFEGKH